MKHDNNYRICFFDEGGWILRKIIGSKILFLIVIDILDGYEKKFFAPKYFLAGI